MEFKLIYPRWEKLEKKTRLTLLPQGPVVFAVKLPDYVDVEFVN